MIPLRRLPCLAVGLVACRPDAPLPEFGTDALPPLYQEVAGVIGLGFGWQAHVEDGVVVERYTHDWYGSGRHFAAPVDGLVFQTNPRPFCGLQESQDWWPEEDLSPPTTDMGPSLTLRVGTSEVQMRREVWSEEDVHYVWSGGAAEAELGIPGTTVVWVDAEGSATVPEPMSDPALVTDALAQLLAYGQVQAELPGPTQPGSWLNLSVAFVAEDAQEWVLRCALADAGRLDLDLRLWGLPEGQAALSVYLDRRNAARVKPTTEGDWVLEVYEYYTVLPPW